MEMQLLGASTYSIPDWNGLVQVNGLQLFQVKRISGSRNLPTIFRKVLKVIKGEHSPVDLPKGLVADDLDITDFTRILIALVSMGGGRQVQKTIECPFCGVMNPRVIDLIKTFIPTKPEIEGGKVELVLSDKKDEEKAPKRKAKVVEEVKVDDTSIKVVCRNITIGNYLKVAELSEVLLLADAKRRFGDVADLNDQEDLDDFKNGLMDIGTVAASVTINGKNDMPLDDRIKWLANLSTENLTWYDQISAQVIKLSPDMNKEYKTICQNTKCGKDLLLPVEASEYFFGLQ